jgi:creatinine amidohydrolase
MDPVILQDLIGTEAEQAFDDRDRWVILPLGSTEYHGPRGPYGTDHYSVWEIAQRVSARTGAPLLPSLPYGHSPDHKSFAGTIHLEYETMKRVLLDIVESLRRHGVSRLLMLLGHWGNYQVALETREVFCDKDPELRIEVVRLFDNSVLALAGLDQVFEGKYSRGHGGAREVSVALYARPHLSPPSPEQVATAYPPLEERKYGELGWQGLPEEASVERGEKAAEITAESIVRYLCSLTQ